MRQSRGRGIVKRNQDSNLINFPHRDCWNFFPSKVSAEGIVILGGKYWQQHRQPTTPLDVCQLPPRRRPAARHLATL
jgi:hypothetical protein